jgi:hypothetical protein
MSDLLGTCPAEGGTSAYTELLMVAATEVCAYLGRASASRRPERNSHAPARRAARTMVGGRGTGRARVVRTDTVQERMKPSVSSCRDLDLITSTERGLSLNGR